MRRFLVAVGGLSLLLGACGDTDGDGDPDLDPVAAAEQQVARAEDALADAQASFDEASAAFCGDATDYVTAVDRYGKLFTDVAATVGDVTTAGRDLEEPEDDAAESASDAKEAREDLDAAEEELVEARATLAEAQAAAGSSTTAVEEPPTGVQAVEPASIDRVHDAQAELDAAFEGVDANMTLTDAGEQVNAAAYALEIAWLRVLGDAGCITDEEQAKVVQEIAAYTSALQTSLSTAGYYDGPVDGVYGPATADAVAQLQTDEGLPATGFVDQATALALQAAIDATGEEAEQQAVAHTAAVQSILLVAGYWNGEIDGEWSDALTAAVKELQTDLGVPATGVIDAATLSAVQAAVAEAQEQPAPTTTSTTVAEGSTSSTTAP